MFLLLLFFNIFQFSLTAGFDAAAAAAAAGGGGGEKEGSLLLETLPWGNGLTGASISADDTGATADYDDLLTTTTTTATNPSIQYADASPQSQKEIPLSENNNNNHGCRAEVLLTPNNSKRMKRQQQQARDVKKGFCANENISPSSSSVTTEQKQQEQEQQQQQDGAQKKTTPPEALFGGGRGRGRGGGRPGPGPAKPDPGIDGGDPLPKEEDDGDPNAAANFSPTANPNLCRDPNHPIPVCHTMVQSIFGDSENTLYELPRCYPLNLLDGCDVPKVLYCCATAYLDPLDGLWVGISCVLMDRMYLPDPHIDRLNERLGDSWDF